MGNRFKITNGQSIQLDKKIMDTKILARVISAELDNGDNNMLDGIAGIDKVARAIADEMDTDERAKFLKLCGLN